MEADPGTPSAEAERVLLAGRRPAVRLGLAEVPAGARVEALGSLAVLSRGGLADLAAGAEAAVDEAGVAEALERRCVLGRPLRLADRLAVPVDADRREVVKLAADVLGAGAVGVEVLDPDQEPGAGRAGEQPGEQRCP